MRIAYQDNKMIVSGLEHFDLAQCLTCGQAFRWRAHGDGFVSAVHGKEVRAQQNGDTLTLHGVDESSGAAFLRYFDLERDYGAIKQSYADEPYLSQGMTYAHGIRVLRQPVFETLISFIISANNNVKRITGIVEKLCKRHGKSIGDSYDFPTAQSLAEASEEDIRKCGAGYRARYIAETAKMVADGYDLGALADMSFAQARQELTVFPGVGLKVADCVCLYALGFTQSFPADVWMKRVLCNVYGYTGKNDTQLRAFVDEHFGAHAGIAQQYLFHYARTGDVDKACKPEEE